MVPEERGFMDSNFEDNQWCLSNVRATLLYEVDGGSLTYVKKKKSKTMPYY
jgi:hypothetical protein